MSGIDFTKIDPKYHEAVRRDRTACSCSDQCAVWALAHFRYLQEGEVIEASDQIDFTRDRDFPRVPARWHHPSSCVGEKVLGGEALRKTVRRPLPPDHGGDALCVTCAEEQEIRAFLASVEVIQLDPGEPLFPEVNYSEGKTHPVLVLSEPKLVGKIPPRKELPVKKAGPNDPIPS